MPEQDKPFVINDRRKFRMDGEPRETTPAEPAASTNITEMPRPAVVTQDAPATGPIPVAAPRTNDAHLITPVPEPDSITAAPSEEALEVEAGQPDLPPPPTPEEIEQVRHAYDATAERLDVAMRSQNLGAERLPPMDFSQLVQSIYMSAMIQLGAGTQQGQPARVDLMGAKQSIDMLGVIAEKTGSNLSEPESKLIEAALFELRMGFLEITQLLARQAAAKTPGAPGTGPAGAPTGAGGGFGSGGGSFTGGGPRIVR